MNNCLRVLVLGKIGTIHTQRFVDELQHQGIEVGVISFSTSPYASTNVHFFKPKRIPPKILGLPGTAKLGNILFINRIIRQFRPHVVHVHHEANPLIYLRWIADQVPLVAYSAWGHYSVEEKVNTAFQKGLARVNLLISDAPDVLDEIADISPSAKQGIVRFGADVNLFTPGVPNSDILKIYGLDLSIPYIFSPRSLRENYNQLTLIRALPEIIKEFPDIRLILKHHHDANYADSVAYQEKIQVLAESLGVWDRIVRIDHVPYEHLVHLYRVSRLAISIPLEDGFPATIFEAMATGCPLVVSQDGSYDGVVENGYNAFCVNAQDVKQVADAIIRILANPILSTELCEHGLLTVQNKGDFRKEISHLIQLYKDTLAQQNVKII